MQEILQEVYFGNTVKEYLIALAIFIGGVIILNIFRKIILNKLKKWSDKTETEIDDFLIRGIEKTALPLLYFGALYIAVKSLTLSDTTIKIINVASIVIVTFFIVRLIMSVISFSLTYYLKRKGSSEEKQRQLRGLVTLISIFLWAIALIFLLDNLGYDISAIITGLGIGGIAIALAAQAVLGDLFSYFVIFFDRPFEIGDFIIVGDKLGVVEYIGIKTTRVRAIGGEQLVFANTDLTSSRVHNYKKMERRRVVFKIGVVYQTKAEQLKQISELVKQIIVNQEDATFDRGHFASYGDFSLIFEFVYYVTGSDYAKYMDIQQAINLKIYEEFENRGIEFAYPTQTLFLNKQQEGENLKSEVVK